MIFNRNRYVTGVVALFILASCSITSKKLLINTNELSAGDYQKDIQEIYDYKNFFNNDLKIIQDAIDSQNLNQSQLRDIKLLQKNYRKILNQNKYLLELNPSQKYSKELMKLIYQLNLPIHISWNEKKQIVLPAELLSRQIEGFCSSLYDDSTSSINKEISKISSSTLVIYSPPYASFVDDLKSVNSKIFIAKYNSSNFQEFASEILGINFSQTRFNKISNLNPNQKIDFTPRSRSDFKQVVLLLEPKEFRAMIPALRYHGGRKFKYVNFISSLEDLDDPLQLLDYEDSYTPISNFLSKKIKDDSSKSIENFLEYGILGDWLLTQVLKQANVQSAKINGALGTILFKSNSCAKREIPMQKINSNLFSL